MSNIIQYLIISTLFCGIVVCQDKNRSGGNPWRGKESKEVYYQEEEKIENNNIPVAVEWGYLDSLAGIYYLDEVPYSGPVIKQLEIGLLTGEFKAGLKHGLWQTLNKIGQPIMIGHFQNGNRDGQFLYFDNKGKLQAQENYLNDQLHGEQITIHSTGKINTKSEYENGVKNGLYSKFYKTGKLQETGAYLNGEKNGEITWYYDTGDKNIVYTYKNGQLDGPTLIYSKDGSIIEEGRYSKGVKE